jgi:bacillopeptidase F (M6 metalloprotease family)
MEEVWANAIRNRENREKKAKEQVTQRIKSTNSEDATADADKAINPEIEQQKTGEIPELTTTIEKKEELIESADEHAIGVQIRDAKVEIQGTCSLTKV